MDAYKELVRKCVLEAEALDPSQVISRGLSEAEVDNDGTGQKVAVPGDYAFAWKVLLNTPPVLVVTGHSETDQILKIVYGLATAFRKYRHDNIHCTTKLEMMKELLQKHMEKKEEAKQVASDARHVVEEQSRYQKQVQDRLEQVERDHRGTPDELTKVKDEWQYAVMLAGRNLLAKGLEYSHAFESLKLGEKKEQKKKDLIDKVILNGNKAKQQLQQYALPNVQYVIARIEEVLSAMKKEKGDDESKWGPNEEVDEILKEMKTHFLELGLGY